MVKNKVYSFLNIVGLASGMAVAMIIGLWIYDEVSGNKHFKNYDTLYQVMMHQTFDGKRGSQTALPFPIGEELKTKFTDLKADAMCDWGQPHSLDYGEKRLSKPGHLIGQSATEMVSKNVLQ